MTLSLALLLVYSVLQVALGLWIGRRVRGGGDFFVAGRGLSAGLVFSTFLAANIGAGSTVGATGIGWANGLSAWWWNGSAGLGSLALAFWVGPRIWREAKAHGDLTVGDFLERYYGRALRGLVASLIWLSTFAILSGQLIGIAAVLQVAGGVPSAVGYFAGAMVAVTYFVAGGLLSSAWVNRVQLILILVGFAVVTPIALTLAGGVERIASLHPEGFLGGDQAVGWRYLFILGPAFIVSPGLLQKAFGAESESALTKGVALNGLVLLLFAFAPAILGAAAYALYPDLASRNLALPTLIAHALPTWAAALALAAVFSAEVSTADAVLFMLATSGSRDLYAGFVNRRATDAQILKMARLIAIVGALVGVALAFVFQSVEQALQTFYALLTVTMFVPVLAALHVRVRGQDGFAAVVGGLGTLLAVHLSTAGAGYGVLTPTLAGILASGATFTASTFLPIRSSTQQAKR